MLNLVVIRSADIDSAERFYRAIVRDTDSHTIELTS